MKKSEIEVGGEYAVAIAHMRQGTRAGERGLVRATVLGLTEDVKNERGYVLKRGGEVKVRLAEPYSEGHWTPVAHKGKTDFTIPTRKVVATWAEHEPAAKARDEREAQEKATKEAKDAAVAKAKEELRDFLPPELQPDWIVEGRFGYGDGGRLTATELLAIVNAAYDRGYVDADNGLDPALAAG